MKLYFHILMEIKRVEDKQFYKIKEIVDKEYRRREQLKKNGKL